MVLHDLSGGQYLINPSFKGINMGCFDFSLLLRIKHTYSDELLEVYKTLIKYFNFTMMNLEVIA